MSDTEIDLAKRALDARSEVTRRCFRAEAELSLLRGEVNDIAQQCEQLAARTRRPAFGVIARRLRSAVEGVDGDLDLAESLRENGFEAAGMGGHGWPDAPPAVAPRVAWLVLIGVAATVGMAVAAWIAVPM